MSEIIDALPLPEVYYLPNRTTYYIEDAKKSWITVNETGAKRILKSKGYLDELTKENANISHLDQVIIDVQTQQNICYAAPLAGYNSGKYEISGKLILVTDSPKLIQPVEGDWHVLESVLEGMFNLEDEDQRPYVYAWLKIALQSLREHSHQPGQMLAMAGPVGAAKSLFQNLITVMLGGRKADPYSFMTDRVEHNGDLFPAEHLMVEDKTGLTDHRSRKNFAAKIKEIVANRTQNCHGKYQQALTLTPMWRLTVSLNDDPERLLVLPPLDEDIADKIILLKVSRKEMPMPTNTANEQTAFWSKLISELPAFVYFLDQWVIPDELASPRFGVKAFHHPELVSALITSATELQLLEIIDAVIFFGNINPPAKWDGTAAELQAKLMNNESSCKEAVRRILNWANACGAYLGRLEKATERVSHKRVNGITKWTITAPEGLDVEDPSPRSLWAR